MDQTAYMCTAREALSSTTQLLHGSKDSAQVAQANTTVAGAETDADVEEDADAGEDEAPGPTSANTTKTTSTTRRLNTLQRT